MATYRQLFLLLVGLGLLARVLVPAGWMPHVDDGGVRLVLCAGPAAAPVSASDESMSGGAHDGHTPSPAPDQDQAQGAGSCPFTLAAAPALLAAGPTAVTLLPVAIDPLFAPALGPRAPRLAAPPPPAIGPPTA